MNNLFFFNDKHETIIDTNEIMFSRLCLIDNGNGKKVEGIQITFKSNPSIMVEYHSEGQAKYDMVRLKCSLTKDLDNLSKVDTNLDEPDHLKRGGLGDL